MQGFLRAYNFDPRQPLTPGGAPERTLDRLIRPAIERDRSDRRTMELRPGETAEPAPAVLRPGGVYENGDWRPETPAERARPKNQPMASKENAEDTSGDSGMEPEDAAPPAPPEPGDKAPDKQEKESGIDADAALQGAGATLGRTLVKDASVREWYQGKIDAASRELQEEIRTGKTPLNGAAAKQAFDAREELLKKARGRGTEVGEAIAEKIKKSGGDFKEFQERKAQRTYGKGYQSLSTKQKTDLWRGIVESSGRDNPKVSAMMKNLGRVGRGLWVATAALAAYNVLESDDKLKTAGKEGAKIGGGVLGGMTGGAVAGWICGPGAPVCSGVGILVGGVAGAMGVDVGLDFLSGLFEDDKE